MMLAFIPTMIHGRWSQDAVHKQIVKRGGFTLVELLIVVVVLAIFAAFVVQSISNTEEEAQISAAQNVTKMVQRKIEEHHARYGEWPQEIPVNWFLGYKLPVNPLEPDHRKTIQNDYDRSNNPFKYHPRTKTTRNWPFWYNLSNGAFRIRVPEQESDAETLALYNLVNLTQANSMSDQER